MKYLILIVLLCFDHSINKTDIIGIDVSHYQGKINWDKVNNWKGNEIQFVYVKATEGTTYQDRKYKANFNGALSNNFRVGSYHYFRTSSSIQGQFKNFTSVVDKNKQVLIPMIDVEEKKHWDNRTFHKNLKKFLLMIEDHYKVKPIIYCVNSFYNKYLSYGYEDYQFMIGRYSKNKPYMKKGAWSIWQFSETGRINGIEKMVDIDILNKNKKISDIII